MASGVIRCAANNRYSSRKGERVRVRETTAVDYIPPEDGRGIIDYDSYVRCARLFKTA